MNDQTPGLIADLIERDFRGFLATWRMQVRELECARHLSIPTLNDHIPLLLRELILALRQRADATIAETLEKGTPPTHGVQRLIDGFDIVEVVAEYNILRGCIHDLAVRNSVNLQGQTFHIINRVLDTAIGLAVESFATERALEVQRRREDYLAFVAHDLRTPLNAIALAAQVIDITVPPQDRSEGLSRMIQSLSRNVKQLESLVKKILDESTNLETEVGLKLQRRVFDYWPVVESLIHDLHPIAGTGSTHLVNEVPSDLLIYADAGLLRRVLQNLIANAIRYTPRGLITIGARKTDDGAVESWIRDNGAGIPAEILAVIFDKGETDSQSTGGLGLGLAIVKTFTEAHGGIVTVESQQGVGSTFRFVLPAA